MRPPQTSDPATAGMSQKARALGSIALAPICLGLIAQPAFADIINDAIATGTPDKGTLAPALASETVGVALPITAGADTVTSNGGADGVPNVANVFDNDTLNGAPATTANTTIAVAPGSQVPAELIFDPATGSLGIAPGTPAGTYTFEYTLCETDNPENCRTATVTVAVEAGEIEAADDEVLAINGASGTNDAINVFENDLLNGAALDPEDVIATVSTPATPVTQGALVPELDPATGLLTVPAGTPAGTYTIEYEICEVLNPTNCATATLTIEVEAALIEAAEDTPEPVRSGIGSENAINAFENDTLNGEPVSLDTITATVLTPAADPGVTLDPATGIVSVGTDVPAGTYTIEYEICEVLNPTNCATSSITVVVEPAISTLEGNVFFDDNGDGTQSSEEDDAPGYIVQVVRDGEVIAETTADADGNYSFEGLLSGEGYSLKFINPESGVVFDMIEDITLEPNTTTSNVNAPIDPSGVVYDSLERTPVPGAVLTFLGRNGDALPEECFIDPSQARQTTGSTGDYRFDIVPGANAQCPVGETEYTIALTPPEGYSFVSTVLAPQDEVLDPTGQGIAVQTPAGVGGGSPAGTLAVAQTAVAPLDPSPIYYLRFALETGDPDVINNHIPLDPFLTRGELVVTKTSPKRTANVGDIVPYEITVRNAESFQRADVDVIDILPAGLKYIEGTSLVNGVAEEPESNGRQLTWADQVIPANGSVTYNLALVIGAGVTGGEKVNTGLAEYGANGEPISNRGTAVVTIVPSAVFDCSELIGKVFEDADRDGYQDENEPGVPGVRLGTVNGQLITTDEFGRYHIACAAVPDARIGSNFVLKLDTRTLPLGWEPTTSNPRSIRLTRGKFGELNFGVAPKQEPSAEREEQGE